MIRPRLSAAAAGLLRSLLSRLPQETHRILLSEWRSTDWHSLTFAGERHEIEIRLVGPDPAGLKARFCEGLTEDEISITGHFVADLGLAEAPAPQPDGSLLLRLEALTICE